jgi:N-acetylmuramoyl-L-alanine amidase
MSRLRFRSLAAWPRIVLPGCLLLGVVTAALPVSQTQGNYTILRADGRRPLAYRTTGQTDMVSLDQLRDLFGFRYSEDAVGLIVEAGGTRILLLPGQSYARVGADVVSLAGPVQREKNAWQVPIDFLSRALGPALKTRIDVRRSSHLVIVGDLRVPLIGMRVERAGDGARLSFDIQPPTPHQVARDGHRIEVRFDAYALDVGALSGTVPEFVTAIRAQDTSLVIDLGPSAGGMVTDAGRGDSRLTIELAPPGAAPEAGAPPPPRPVFDMTPAGVIRTVVIDPGHGGDDDGVVSASGTKEKDLALQIAVRLKAAIESRMGLRVLLTRDGDHSVPLDRRSALANNNKADLFVSLHAGGSPRRNLSGAHVMSLRLDHYAARAPAQSQAPEPVPIVGGGTRPIAPVPWDLAQLPYGEDSVLVGRQVLARLSERSVPLYSATVDTLPLRVLAGVNMPAILVEAGFLTNVDDERALKGERLGVIVEVLADTIAAIRRGVRAASTPGGPR